MISPRIKTGVSDINRNRSVCLCRWFKTIFFCLIKEADQITQEYPKNNSIGCVDIDRVGQKQRRYQANRNR